jgi:HlyD family secretion protein
MSRTVSALPAAVCLLFAACNRSAPPSVQAASPPPIPQRAIRREIRITGVVQAVHAVKITVPIIQSQTASMTLTQLAQNGSHVEAGDLVAAFDPTLQQDAARDAQAKFEDLSHQVDQKIAENRVAAEKRTTDMRQAQAELDKAKLELKKSEVLPVLDVEENNARAAAAAAQVASLKVSQAAREKAEAAALRSIELQRDRQKINMQRAQDNIKKMELRAPLAGMLVHDMTYRANSYGHAQIGDQLNRSYPLASIFDPSRMQVRCSVNETDFRALSQGGEAIVRLDAYPDLELPAHLLNASPVAASALGAPIKNFNVVFSIERADPHLLPDLSAAVALTAPEAPPASGDKR